MARCPSRIRSSAVAAFALCAWLAAPRTEAACKPWLQLQTDRFRVISALPEKATTDIVNSLARFQAATEMVTTAGQARPSAPTTLYVFRKEDWPFEDWGGFFYSSPGDFENTILVSEPDKDLQAPYQTVMHEYVHYLIRAQSGHDYPQWYNEGLAEVLGAVVQDLQMLRVGVVSAGQIDILESRKWIPLRELLQTTTTWDNYRNSADADIFYAESALLVHYFMLGNEKRRIDVNEYIELRSQGVELDEAFRQAFETDYATLEKELRTYVDRDKFYWVGIERSKVPDAVIRNVKPLACIDGQLETGIALLLSSPAAPDGVRKKWLAPVQQERPDDAGTLTGLALAAEASGDIATADRLFDQVMAKPEVDARWLYLAADTWMQRAAKESRHSLFAPPESAVVPAQRAYDALLRAGASSSNDPSALYALAWAELFVDKDLRAGRLAVGKAHQLQPRNASIAQMAAVLSEKDSDWKRAADYWEVVETLATTSDQRQTARKRLEVLRQRQAELPAAE